MFFYFKFDCSAPGVDAVFVEEETLCVFVFTTSFTWRQIDLFDIGAA